MELAQSKGHMIEKHVSGRSNFCTIVCLKKFVPWSQNVKTAVHASVLHTQSKGHMIEHGF